MSLWIRTLDFFKNVHNHCSLMDMQGVYFSPPAVWMCRVYPFPPPAVLTWQGCIPFHCKKHGHAGCIPFQPSSMDVQGVSLSKSDSVEIQGVSLSTARSMDVQGVSPFHLQHCEWAGCIPVYRLQCGCVGAYVSFSKMPECQTAWHLVSPVTVLTKMPKEGARIRGPSPLLECFRTGLRYWMLEGQCWWHQPRCRCQAMILMYLRLL